MREFSMPLENELATYERLKPSLLAQDEGKFAVISGEELLGVYSTYDDALAIGYEKKKLEPFLVKKILAIEPVNFFTHPLPLCRT